MGYAAPEKEVRAFILRNNRILMIKQAADGLTHPLSMRSAVYRKGYRKRMMVRDLHSDYGVSAVVFSCSPMFTETRRMNPDV